MTRFTESKEKLKGVEKSLDPQLWHACAGEKVQMPKVNTKVVYFPQGHAEQACEPVDFGPYPKKIPPLIQCRVATITYMADPETDEVYAKLRLVPLDNNEVDFDDDDDDDGSVKGSENQDKDKTPFFVKTLTQSDANNGGGFSVPRFGAETIFPSLDYSTDSPVQNILVKDVHGETWKFRHIYRGTPRRHLLTTGWSSFVNHKKLVAGDSIVFLRAQNGDLCVGIIRRVNKKEIYGGSCHVSYGLGIMSSSLMGNGIKVKAQEVIEAANLAANKQPFEVVYYPRGSTPEFCVKASLVREALQIWWSSGMRFKMGFEIEDSLRMNWFYGTINSVQVADPTWPDSPWRLLQVTWDEPDLLHNVKSVSPWQVELAESSIPLIHLPPFSPPPPHKKLRLPQPLDFPLYDNKIPLVPSFPSNLLVSPNNNPFVDFLPTESTPASMQGARHSHYAIPLSNIHLNQLHSSLEYHTAATAPLQNHITNDNDSDSVYCKVSLACSSSQSSSYKPDNNVKPPQIVLFGKTIITQQQQQQQQQQISLSSNSADTPSSISDGNNADKIITKFSDSSSGSALHQQQGLTNKSSTSCERFNLHKNQSQESVASLERGGHCKVILESEDVGRSVDLSMLGSYNELLRKLADMFGIEKSEMLSHVLYEDIFGEVKRIGDEPFSDFTRRARRLNIMMDSSSEKGGVYSGRK